MTDFIGLTGSGPIFVALISMGWLCQVVDCSEKTTLCGSSLPMSFVVAEPKEQSPFHRRGHGLGAEECIARKVLRVTLAWKQAQEIGSEHFAVGFVWKDSNKSKIAENQNSLKPMLLQNHSSKTLTTKDPLRKRNEKTR